MCMTAAVATSWKGLCRSSIDSPNRSPPTTFGYPMCRLHRPFVAQHSKPTRQNPTLLSAQRHGRYQYLKDYSTALRRTAISSPLQSHCNSLGQLVATKCCLASTPDRENHNRHHRCHANAQTTHGRNQLDIHFQRARVATEQARCQQPLVFLLS